MKPGTILLPRDLAGPTDLMLRCWRDVEKQGTPYTLVPMMHGADYPVRRDFLIRAVETHHGGCCLGYSLVSVREKLKPEYMGTPGPDLANLRKNGVEIQYRLEVPLVTYLGDTSAGPVFDHPDVQNAEILITECTFFDPAHKQRAKVGKHLHLDDLVGILPKLKNQHLVLTHVSRRISVRRARNLLRRKIGEERMNNIHFLMDFEGAVPAGEVEEAGPPVSETAE
jgi:ribonuclease Z